MGNSEENNDINFIVPVDDIKKYAFENEGQKRGTDSTSKSYSIEDYDIYYDFEEEENNEDKKPIFKIPIQLIKEKKDD